MVYPRVAGRRTSRLALLRASRFGIGLAVLFLFACDETPSAPNGSSAVSRSPQPTATPIPTPTPTHPPVTFFFQIGNTRRNPDGTMFGVLYGSGQNLGCSGVVQSYRFDGPCRGTLFMDQCLNGGFDFDVTTSGQPGVCTVTVEVDDRRGGRGTGVFRFDTATLRPI